MTTSDMFKWKVERLFAEFKAGKKDAFNELANLYRPELIKIAKQIVSSESDAREIAQDAVIKAFRSIQYFRRASSLSIWLYRITVNAAKTRYRKNQRYNQTVTPLPDVSTYYRVSDDRPAIGNYPLNKLAVQQELSILLISKAHLLSHDLYTILHLRYVMLLSYKEIAAILHCPQGTVKSRLHRARNRIRELLKLELL